MSKIPSSKWSTILKIVITVATAVLDEHERDNGCALINFGGLTTTLSIFENGALQQLVTVPL